MGLRVGPYKDGEVSVSWDWPERQDCRKMRLYWGVMALDVLRPAEFTKVDERDRSLTPEVRCPIAETDHVYVFKLVFVDEAGNCILPPEISKPHHFPSKAGVISYSIQTIPGRTGKDACILHIHAKEKICREHLWLDNGRKLYFPTDIEGDTYFYIPQKTRTFELEASTCVRAKYDIQIQY